MLDNPPGTQVRASAVQHPHDSVPILRLTKAVDDVLTPGRPGQECS